MRLAPFHQPKSHPPKSKSYDGAQRQTLDMGANSFLAEVAFRTTPDQTAGVLVSKMAQAGYELGMGRDGGPIHVSAFSAAASAWVASWLSTRATPGKPAAVS